MVRGKNGSREKWSPENWSPENVLQKFFSIKRKLRNWNDVFYFYRLAPLHTKKPFDVHLTILHARNCRILKESRKICCWVLGFHRLITSQNFTHTTMLDVHLTIFCFSVFRDHFSGEQFSGIHFDNLSTTALVSILQKLVLNTYR